MKMPFNRLLAISSLGVIILFWTISSRVLPYLLYSGPPAPPLHYEIQRKLVKIGHQSQSLEQTLNRLKELADRNDSGVTCWLPDGSLRRLSGELPHIDSTALADAWAGIGTHRLQVYRSAELWYPMHREGKVAAVVCFRIEGKSPAGRSRALTALVGLLFCLAGGFWINHLVSSPLRRLLRGVHSIELNQLGQRLPEKGPLEVAELARAFNAMTGRLDKSANNLAASRRKAERLEAQRRELVGDVAHNMGTPLSSVQLRLEDLQQQITDVGQSRQLARIQSQLRFVNRAVKRLLDCSRLEFGAAELSIDEFTIGEPLMEAADAIESRVALLDASLSLEGCDPRTMVKADQGMLRELFQLLLENAILHGGQGVAIEVRLKSRGQRLLIEVLDDGPGVPTLDLPNLKKRFWTSSEYGTGLGLGIADKLARAHGSSLTLENRPEGGFSAGFSVELAIVPPPHQSEAGAVV